jgi:uncharacterized protein YpiB (UPF0302 family)
MKNYLIEGYNKMLIQMVILKSMSQMEKKMLLKEIQEALQKL